jgi:CRP-like cAMP-binding protein
MFTEIEAGSFFGEPSAPEGAPPRSPNLCAVEESALARMPSASFAETAFGRGRLREAVVATLAARNRAMTQRVVEAAHICGNRLTRVGPARSRPPQSCFGEQRAGARCASGNPWQARR